MNGSVHSAAIRASTATVRTTNVSHFAVTATRSTPLGQAQQSVCTGGGKEDALGCGGFLLDIENSGMCPDDFGEVFPHLEFAACSSWSHTPDAPRYRIAIPSVQFIPLDIHTLETAGWETP
jgi:hypothetical protein